MLGILFTIISYLITSAMKTIYYYIINVLFAVLLRVSDANEVPISSYIGSLDDIQTALKPLKKSEKSEIYFHGHFKTSFII